MKTAAQLWETTEDRQFRRAIENWTTASLVAQTAERIFEKEVGYQTIDEAFLPEYATPPFDGVLRWANALRNIAWRRLQVLPREDGLVDDPLVTALHEYETLLGSLTSFSRLSAPIAITNAVGLHVMLTQPPRDLQLSPRMRDAVLTKIRSEMLTAYDGESPQATGPRETLDIPQVRAMYEALLPAVGPSLGLG